MKHTKRSIKRLIAKVLYIKYQLQVYNTQTKIGKEKGKSTIELYEKREDEKVQVLVLFVLL